MRNKKLNFKMSNDKSLKMPGIKKERKIKWWHILLMVLGVLIIAAGIMAAIIWGNIKDMVSGLESMDDGPGVSGSKVDVGTYLPKDDEPYILSEYTNLMTGEKTVFLQKENELRFDCKAYYVFISADGEFIYQFSNEYNSKYTPQQIKDALFARLKNYFGYTDEKLVGCDVAVFDPVSFTKVKLSSVTVTDDGKATVKYSAGALDGELSEEYELNGTYTKTETAFTFAYSQLPENELLRGVAEKLLISAKKDSYVMGNGWENTLVFADTYILNLQAE